MSGDTFVLQLPSSSSKSKSTRRITNCDDPIKPETQKLVVSSSSSFCVPIEQLQDDILLEILHRIPCTKSATLCKCVCKRWYHLITSGLPLFIRRFICHRRRQEQHQQPFGFIAQSNNWRLENHVRVDKVIRTFTPPKEKNQRVLFKSRCSGGSGSFSLSFLPCCFDDDESEKNIWVLASFNDLLVCCPSMYDHSVYYICNPVTKQWATLPPPPRCSHWASFHNNQNPRRKIRVAFICDPYCTDSDNVVLHCCYGFKLVCVPPNSMERWSDNFVEIFSSETGKWTTLGLHGRSSYSYIQRLVVYNGLVLWPDRCHTPANLIGFNPQDYCGNGHPSMVMLRKYTRLPAASGVASFGLCQGNLRMLSIRFGNTDEDKRFCVWELNNGKWSLVHKVPFMQMTSGDKSWLSKWPDIFPLGLTFHPSDPDIVYFQLYHRTLVCNMKTRTFEVVGKGPREQMMPLHLEGVFPLVLPWWPTPIPRLPCQESWDYSIGT